MRLRQTIRQRTSDRHVHTSAYASVVLEGGYEEAGDQGRFRVGVADVIFHDRFEAHLNRFEQRGAVVLNLAIPDHLRIRTGLGKVSDIDTLVRIAGSDRRAALHHLVESVPARLLQCQDWEDVLCREMQENPRLRLSEWAESNGFKPWNVSRGFKQVFEVSPECFRARARARAAWERIRSSGDSLAAVALAMGFTDQAHMTHGVKALPACTPASWRPANGYKIDGRAKR